MNPEVNTPLSRIQGRRAERIQELATACALDRENLRRVFRSASRRPAPPAGEGLRRVLGITDHLPGAVGRWSRRISLGANLLGLLRRSSS